MSTGARPIDCIWWLVSRASGIVALVLITLSVLIGLAMAAKLLRRPGLKRSLIKLHEHVALTALLAIGAHGVALLGDQWLKPGWRGITIPFALSYRPQFTALGIIAGYIALLLGPSFYLRRRIGTRRWRRLHSLILVVWVLSAVHTLGTGSDARTLWLRLLVLAPGVAVIYLVVLRILKPENQTRREKPRRRLSHGAALATGTMAFLLMAPAPALGREKVDGQTLGRIANGRIARPLTSLGVFPRLAEVAPGKQPEGEPTSFPEMLRQVDPYRRRGPVYRFICRFSLTKPGIWLSQNIAWKLDPYLLKLTRGRVSSTGPVASALLETRGARTGAPRRTATLYFHDGNRVIIVASKRGLPTHPSWYHNVCRNPDVVFGGQPFRARVVDDEAERQRLWNLADRVFPQFADYRASAGAAGRTIPIVELIPR